MRTVSLGFRSAGSVAVGGASATPLPLTPSWAQPARARVGPKSGPPCFFEPPTRVGPIPLAPATHRLAPGQPSRAISCRSTSPTVGGVPTGMGQVKWA